MISYEGLENALKKTGYAYEIDAGGGAFYGEEGCPRGGHDRPAPRGDK